MRHKTTFALIAGGLAAIVLLGGIVCFVDSLRYPKIARSAYWKRPQVLAKATFSRIFHRRGTKRSDIVQKAHNCGAQGSLDTQMFYLPDYPDDDKTIKARVFGLIAKTHAPTDENLFWIVRPQNRRSDLPDETLVFEYRTGRLVCPVY
jgi:hypothetical protein